MRYVPKKACRFCGQDVRWPDPEYLRQLREAAGLTMRQMAKAAGFANASSIDAIEAGRCRATEKPLAAYAALEVKP